MDIDPERARDLFVDLDLRLARLWADVAAVEEWDVETAWLFIRMGYGLGYLDCFVEGEDGKLFKDNNMPLPPRAEGREHDQ